jgi:hypothetical protein
MDFADLFAARKWLPIRNCPGRYALAGGCVAETPEAICGRRGQEFRSSAARDLVVVAAFADGAGLISYKRADGSYLHTLNTPEGFVRKLNDLQIVLRSFV